MNATHCPTCKRRYTKRDQKRAYEARLRAEKKEKSEKHRQSTKEIRAACVERAVGACELGVACVQGPFRRPLEWHHLEGGSGRRREKQSISNTLMACWACHHSYHRRPQDFAKAMARWAALHNYPTPKHVEHAQLPKKRIG